MISSSNNSLALLRRESGASMVEYAIALGLLIAVFILGGSLLREKSEVRYQESTRVVDSMAPCGASGGSLGGAGNAEECL